MSQNTKVKYRIESKMFFLDVATKPCSVVEHIEMSPFFDTYEEAQRAIEGFYDKIDWSVVTEVESTIQKIWVTKP